MNHSTFKFQLGAGRSRGVEILDGIPIPGYDRFEFRDPFGICVKFLQSSRTPPQLQTERLQLRLPEERDVESILRYFRKNERRFAPTDPPKPEGFYTDAYWWDQVRKAHSEFRAEQALRFHLFRKGNEGELVGRVNFTQMVRGPFQACNLGYATDEDYEGQGLMTEALSASIDYVFGTLNFHRVMANHLPENERSARLLKRLGFVVEGRAPNYLFINGEWREHILNALTHFQWRSTL